MSEKKNQGSAVAEPVRRQAEPTMSADDTQLYTYTPADTPDDVVINVGTSPVLVAAPHATGDPQRIEVGDRRRGAYYMTCLARLPGLMQLKRVDMKRLEAVNKLRDIRIGKREPDWVMNARKKSAEQGGQQPRPHNPLMDESPTTRAARGI